MRKSAEHGRRQPLLLLVVATLATLASMAFAPTASAHHLNASVQLALPVIGPLPTSPDLYPLLPTFSTSYGGTVPAVFVDTDEFEGTLLYRFDTVIANQGGTLDLFCQSCNTSGRTISQVLWPGGRPPSDDLPSATGPPTNTQFAQSITRPSGPGGWMFYSPLQGHNHWHYDRAAVYELIVPGVGSLQASKTLAGFCFFDTYDQRGTVEAYFIATGAGNPGEDPDDLIPDDQDWCRPGGSSQSFIRMGISPGVGDYYAAQLTDQWVDITGVPPGPVTLKATVNPDGAILESDTTNNAYSEPRIIPGAIATPIAATLPAGLGGPLQLSGVVVGPEVPIFLPDALHAGAQPCALRFGDCYAPADPNVLAFEIVSGPSNGTATIAAVNGLTATLQVTPNAAYVGPDTITYLVRDTRGLASATATISIDVSDGLFNTMLPTISGTPAVNAKLTAKPGSWLPQPAAHAYQWKRCNATGEACANIGGATLKAYTIRKVDSGSSLRVKVTASKDGDKQSATSAATAAVVGVAKLPNRLVRTLFRGTKRADTIKGTRKHDLIKSGRGGDKIRARAGKDIVKSGNGNDRVYAGKGADIVVTGKGRDRVWARDKTRDVINCGPGYDTVFADKTDKIHRSCEDVRTA